MSYCRFSSDNHKSDVYVYASVYGGFDVHIAKKRYRNADQIPELPFILDCSVEEFNAAYTRQREWFEDAETEDIDLIYAGSYKNLSTLAETKEFLLELKDIGYYIPESCLERINEEIKEE